VTPKYDHPRCKNSCQQYSKIGTVGTRLGVQEGTHATLVREVAPTGRSPTLSAATLRSLSASIDTLRALSCPDRSAQLLAADNFNCRKLGWGAQRSLARLLPYASYVPSLRSRAPRGLKPTRTPPHRITPLGKFKMELYFPHGNFGFRTRGVVYWPVGYDQHDTDYAQCWWGTPGGSLADCRL